MAQKPTQAILNFLSRRKRFYLDEAVKETGLDRRKALRVLEKLHGNAFLNLLADERTPPRGSQTGPPRRNPRYEIVKDLGQRTPKRPECARDKIWRVFRYMRKVTRSDLARISGCSESSAEQYTRHLEKHGYIRAAGKRGKEKIWLLVKDTGPKKPKIKEVI